MMFNIEERVMLQILFCHLHCRDFNANVKFSNDCVKGLLSVIFKFNLVQMMQEVQVGILWNFLEYLPKNPQKKLKGIAAIK